jgi:2,3-diketo-5-methylthio-1-phosphopentane phosphatase
VLVTDFDSTITQRDFYALLVERYGAPDYFRDYAQGRMTHFDAMRAIMAYAPQDAAALDRVIAALEPDDRLRWGIECLRRHGWETVVVSAGSSWYIDRVLNQAGVEVCVYANPGRIEPGRGLVLELPVGSPFFSPEAGIDKAAVVRDALARSERVAFAGDGPPDLASALLVDAKYRFARGWLARGLKNRKIPFLEFSRWSDIARALVPECGQS